MTAEDSSSPPAIVLDASVVINFLVLDRVGLLSHHPSEFVITQHVAAEVSHHYPEQVARLRAALDSGALSEVPVDQPDELALFRDLSATGRLGHGECSAIALAVHRKLVLAIDDKQARRQAERTSPGLPMLDTQAIVVALVQEGALTVEDADRMLQAWASEHRFRLTIRSFGDLLAD